MCCGTQTKVGLGCLILMDFYKAPVCLSHFCALLPLLVHILLIPLSSAEERLPIALWKLAGAYCV